METANSPLDILPHVFRIADAIHQKSDNDLARMDKSVTCGPGCSVCCNQLVPVSRWEALHLASLVGSLPASIKKRVIHRFNTGMERLSESGLLSQLTEGFERHTCDNRAMGGLKRAYWELRIPCPFLEDNSCSIHPARPLACRQFSVTSAPSRCAAIYTREQNHEVVLHAADTASAFAAFSGEGITQTHVLPHIFALRAAPSFRTSATPMPGEQMLGRFLNLLAECFVRRSHTPQPLHLPPLLPIPDK
ncbi:YkgJ family cysteine cluster protein [Pseudodesulfovibrio sp.]|uniref:YkgJ family cysteine cluster protein n=1 Tax=unclassified Pseudodesulfovibrio TaxID=2661612 RepID=UPI003AFF85DC